MPKWVKMIIAIALLPICAGAAQALWMVIQHSGTADTTWVPLLAGAGCWIVVYLLLPKPMWIYVLGHELTHAVWAWLFGAQVRKLKVTSSGGHVVITKTNFLIALAPYFFPLYAVIVVAVFSIGHLIWNWREFLALFDLFLGAAYAFHITLTGAHFKNPPDRILRTRVTCFPQLLFFSATLVYCCWAFHLLAAKVDVGRAFEWWFECTREVFHRIGQLI